MILNVAYDYANALAPIAAYYGKREVRIAAQEVAAVAIDYALDLAPQIKVLEYQVNHEQIIDFLRIIRNQWLTRTIDSRDLNLHITREFVLLENRVLYSALGIESFVDVKKNGLIVIQMDTYGHLDLSEIHSCYNMDFCESPKITLMWQPYNAWLMIYMFDCEHQPIATVSGHEDKILAEDHAEYVRILNENYERIGNDC